MVVDGALKVPLDANVFSNSLCIVATAKNADKEKLALLKNMPGVEVWEYEQSRYVPLAKLMQDIVCKGFNSVLLEGGGDLAGKMLQEHLIDKIEFIFAPKLAGSGPSPLSGLHLERMSQAIKVTNIEIEQIDVDYILSAELDYNS